MIEAAKQKKFQIIFCKSQSRFTRDMEPVEKYIHGLFPIWGIRFIAVADNADTEVKGNKKARQINGLVNERYLEDLSENVRMVFDLKRRGIPNPTRYKAERGWACNHPIKNDFGLWNKVTVGRILTNEMYTGVMIQGRRRKVSYKSKVIIDTPEDQWYQVEGTHEAIIDRATFQAVQRGLKLHTRTDGTGETHLLAGLVKCADSGSKRLCTRHSVRLNQLIDLISERIRYYVQTYYQLDPKDLQPQKDTHREALEQEQKSLTTQLEKRSQALKTLYLDRVAGILSEGQFVELNQSFLEAQSPRNVLTVPPRGALCHKDTGQAI